MKSVYIRSFSGPYYSRIQTKYSQILRVSWYSVGMRENADQKNSEYGHFSSSESYSRKSILHCKSAIKNEYLMYMKIK